MATQAQLAIGEYLQTSYRPDREYIDGELRERHVGKHEHARLQALLTIWIGIHEKAWNVIVATEQRTFVAGSRVRIPDLVILTPGRHPAVISEPPMLVIEILSPDDTYSDTQERSADYQRMGVQSVWIIDPQTRTGRMCVGSNWTAATRLEVPGTPIYVELAEMFDQINPPDRP
jgi:Uma2 family endonuclease